MAALNLLDIVNRYNHFPLLSKLLGAVDHFQFFTLSIVLACVMNGQKVLMLLSVCMILLMTFSTPRFNILQVVFPTAAGIVIGNVIHSLMKENRRHADKLGSEED